MSAGLDDEGSGAIDVWSHIAAAFGQFGQGAGRVEFRRGFGNYRKLFAFGAHHGDEPGENLLFDGDGAFGSRRNSLIERREFSGDEAHRRGNRLPVDKDRGLVRRRQHGCGRRRHFDEIAQNIVMPHFERLDAGLIGIA